MKKKFLSTLEAYLEPLSKDEREEILRFYEERFEASMMYEGKTEQEVIDELETPKQIARNVLLEYGYTFTDKKPIEEPSNTIKSGSLVGLVLFDILTVFVIIPFFFALFVGFVSGWFGFVTRIRAVGFYEFLFIFGLAFLWALVIVWIYDVIVGFASWLIRWHIDTLRLHKARPIAKRVNRLQVAYFYKKNPTARKWKNALALVAIVALFVGGITSIVQGVAWRLNLGENPLQETIETKDMSSAIAFDESWVIESNLAIGGIRIVRSESSTLNVISNELEDFSVTIVIDEDSNRIYVENTVERRFFTFNFIWNLFGDQPEVVIEVPQDLDITHIQLEGQNGSIYIDGISTNEIIVETLNAAVYIRNVEASSITIDTTNGRIDLRDVTVSNEIDANTTNGKIDFNRVDAELINVMTTNGTIEIRNVHVGASYGARLDARTTNGGITLSNVYVLRVELRTTNGNINYSNTDNSFVLDRLRAETTNGSRNITVDADILILP